KSAAHPQQPAGQSGGRADRDEAGGAPVHRATMKSSLGARRAPKLKGRSLKEDEMATATATSLSKLESILGTDARSLLEHKCETIPKSQLHLPGPDFVSRIFATSDRPTRVLRSLESFFDHDRLGATIYFGSPESDRQIQEISAAFHEAHELGMATVLWCYVRNPAFTKDGVNYEVAADLTGQANHMGVSIEADIIKQKLPETNRGFDVLKFGKTSKAVYEKLTTDHPIDLTRYQVANCYMGRSGLINSGGASSGESDLKEAVKTAVINKRAGGTGLITGRKAFMRPMSEGIQLLN